MNESRRGADRLKQDKRTVNKRSGGLNRKEKGAAAERMAAERLQALGYRIIHKNWRCRSGEIDIIARDGNCWVFIEVRSRYGAAGAVEAAEAIDWRKQHKVRAVAEVYVNRYRLHEAGIGSTPSLLLWALILLFPRTLRCSVMHFEAVS